MFVQKMKKNKEIVMAVTVHTVVIDTVTRRLSQDFPAGAKNTVAT